MTTVVIQTTLAPNKTDKPPLLKWQVAVIVVTASAFSTLCILLFVFLCSRSEDGWCSCCVQDERDGAHPYSRPRRNRGGGRQPNNAGKNENKNKKNKNEAVAGPSGLQTPAHRTAPKRTGEPKLKENGQGQRSTLSNQAASVATVNEVSVMYIACLKIKHNSYYWYRMG